MLVSEVHPVAILSPRFCVTCSAVSCLSEIIGAYIVPAYSSMGLVTVRQVIFHIIQTARAVLTFLHLTEPSEKGRVTTALRTIPVRTVGFWHSLLT